MYASKLKKQIIKEFLNGECNLARLAKKHRIKKSTPYYWIYKQFGKEKIIELKYKYLEKLSETEKAYIAGIIDGEGSIFLKRHNKKLVLILVVTNTSQKLMKYLKKRLKGHITYLKRKNSPKHWKKCYAWVAYYNLAQKTIQRLLPYFLIKKEQAKVALKWNIKQSSTKKKQIKRRLQKLNGKKF